MHEHQSGHRAPDHRSISEGPPTAEIEAALASIGTLLHDARSAAVAKTLASADWQVAFARIRASVPAGAIADEHDGEIAVPAEPTALSR